MPPKKDPQDKTKLIKNLSKVLLAKILQKIHPEGQYPPNMTAPKILEAIEAKYPGETLKVSNFEQFKETGNFKLMGGQSGNKLLFTTFEKSPKEAHKEEGLDVEELEEEKESLITLASKYVASKSDEEASALAKRIENKNPAYFEKSIKRLNAERQSGGLKQLRLQYVNADTPEQLKEIEDWIKANHGEESKKIIQEFKEGRGKGQAKLKELKEGKKETKKEGEEEDAKWLDATTDDPKYEERVNNPNKILTTGEERSKTTEALLHEVYVKKNIKDKDELEAHLKASTMKRGKDIQKITEKQALGNTREEHERKVGKVFKNWHKKYPEDPKAKMERIYSYMAKRWEPARDKYYSQSYKK